MPSSFSTALTLLFIGLVLSEIFETMSGFVSAVIIICAVWSVVKLAAGKQKTPQSNKKS